MEAFYPVSKVEICLHVDLKKRNDSFKRLIHRFWGVGTIDQGKFAKKETKNYMTKMDLVRQSGETISLKKLLFLI